MNGQFTPHEIWLERLNEIGRDLQRLEALLSHDLVAQEPSLGGKFGGLLSELIFDLDGLRSREQKDEETANAWRDLSPVNNKSRKFAATLLEFLGGVAVARGVTQQHQGFDEGFAEQSEQWLNELRQSAGMDRRLAVIAGRGAMLEPDTGIVRLPFLDWDWWHWPLLARSVGLLATHSSSPYRNRIDQVVEPLIEQVSNLFISAQPPSESSLVLPEVRHLWQSYQYAATDADKAAFRAKHQSRLSLLVERTRIWFHHLVAEMFVTAVVGPAYALPVFIFELDYRNPEQLNLADPEQIEGRADAPRFLPAAVHRAAAILATLQAMNQGEESPYNQILPRLENLWHAAIQSADAQDSLDAARQQFNQYHKDIYREVLQRSARPLLKQTTERWQRTETWYKALCGKAAKPNQQSPDKIELAGALWLHRLDVSDSSDAALTLANAFVREQREVIFPQGAKASPAQIITRARLNRLGNRWQRLRNILGSAQIPAGERAAVIGRFYRLLSEQMDEFERHQVLLQGATVRPSVWGKIASLEDGARSLQREALEFLGGLFVREAKLDREPASMINTVDDGVSICDLADVLLQEYSRRTGVNWSARTVLGRDPFLTAETEVIQMRFPDWSLWNLPLMAHEFGHLVALATPAFLDYQRQEERSDHCNAAIENENGQYRRRHLDEFCADVFATYTMGPAFVCTSILLQLNPAEAYLARGWHPTHDERAQVILQTLGSMNESARREDGSREPYARLQAMLSEIWRTAKQDCGATPKDEERYKLQLRQALRWGDYLGRRIITRFYRLGAAYTPTQWEFAQEVAKRLKVTVGMSELQDLMAKFSMDEISLNDVLNALWSARLKLNSGDIHQLTFVANQMGRDYLGSIRNNV